MSSEFTTEIDDLKSQLRLSKNYNERDRLKCILLYKEKRMSLREIASGMYLHINTVHSYISDYNDSNKTKNDTKTVALSRSLTRRRGRSWMHIFQKTPIFG